MRVKGIDISEHNGVIDFSKVKAAGIEFVMIRSSYGQSTTDPRFEYNVAQCEKYGIPWGAYHYSYALNTQQAQNEAKYVLKLMQGKKPSYPIAYDMEDADGYKAKHGMPSDATLQAMCRTFCDTLENANYYTCIYANLSWLNNQLRNGLDAYDKWVAQWADRCTYTKPFGMWQYTDSGKIPGLSGNFDMDYAYKDYPAIMKQAGLNGFEKEEEGGFKMFSDVKPDDYGYNAIKQLKELGIIHGDGDNMFHPDEYITRRDMAIVIDNLLNYIEQK